MQNFISLLAKITQHCFVHFHASEQHKVLLQHLQRHVALDTVTAHILLNKSSAATADGSGCCSSTSVVTAACPGTIYLIDKTEEATAVSSTVRNTVGAMAESSSSRSVNRLQQLLLRHQRAHRNTS